MKTRASRIVSWGSFFLTVGVAPPGSGQALSITVNGETLSYQITGTGTPLVLIHGWSLNQRMWEPQVAPLARHFRVLRYDRRGFGGSTGNEDPSWDAADLKELLDRLGITKAHILGMSQGARVALQFARSYPDRVLSLILQGASAPDGFGLQWTGADRPRFEEWGTMVREQGIDAFRRVWAAHPLMEIPANRPEARARRDELLAEYRGSRFLQTQSPSGPARPFSMNDLPEIRVATLVLVGTREVPFLQIVARVLAYYIPTARLEVVPGGGHLINLIEPARYNAALISFLTAVEHR
jgi:pimeloyl-ACP methyl ester carboxylesterase